MSKPMRCAIYTRKSCEVVGEQREACEEYVKSQKGWVILPKRYGNKNLDREAELCEDIKAGKIDCVVTYKVDLFTESSLKFAEIVDLCEKQGVRFVSVAQSLDTVNPVSKLMLNIILNFTSI